MNLKDILDSEKQVEIKEAEEESRKEKEAERRRKNRENTKYGSMLEDDEE